MRRSLLTTVASVVLMAATTVPAFADSCANVSRPAPSGWTQATVYTQPLLQGGWVWLPSLTSIGIPAQFLPPFWGKVTPGTFDSTLSVLPAQTATTPTARPSRCSVSRLSVASRARHT